MKTNEQIFEEIREQGYITEQQIEILKSRSNREGRDLFDYGLIEQMNNGYGIPMTHEQGVKGLKWLKQWTKKHNTPFGYREIDIINNASPDDFTFWGFYNANHYEGCVDQWPVYELNGLKYVPLEEPYVCG
jgi:hypothetical protein